jgi:hypothetical protein
LITTAITDEEVMEVRMILSISNLWIHFYDSRFCSFLGFLIDEPKQDEPDGTH